MTDDLERRYRRLLTVYPVAHRHAYADEMLGVLLARSRPGQRWPAAGEALNLVRCALVVRAENGVAGLADNRWRDAAAVVGVLLPLLLVVSPARRVIQEGGVALRLGVDLPMPSPAWLSRPVAWLLVLVALAFGLRRVAAAGAWLAVLTHGALLARDYGASPTDVVYGSRPLLLAVIAAAVLSVPVRRRRGFAVLGRRGSAAVVAAGAVAAVAALLDLPLMAVERGEGGVVAFTTPGQLYLPFLAEPLTWYAAACYVAAAAAVLVVVWRLGGPLRRRVAALLFPAVALYLLVRYTFGGFLASSPRFYPTPVLLAPAQWAALALTPVLAFVLAVRLVHRAERRERLIALGRERELTGD